MRVQSQNLQNLFEGKPRGEFDYQPYNPVKDLSKLEVNVDSLRGFFLIGGAGESTQALLTEIHGPVEKPNRELLLSYKQMRGFFTAPTYFFGPKENFIISLNLVFHYREVISYYDRYKGESSLETAKKKAIKKFLEATKKHLHEDPNLQNNLILYRGIHLFDRARTCRTYDKKGSRKLLAQSKVHFIDLLKKGKEVVTAITFIGFIEALLGKVESALSFLIKAADMVFNPKSIYQLMSILYQKLKMKRATKFYKRKSKTGTRRKFSIVEELCLAG